MNWNRYLYRNRQKHGLNNSELVKLSDSYFANYSTFLNATVSFWHTWLVYSFFKLLLFPDDGLRMPNEAFFHWNPELLGLDRQIGQINSGAFGVFSAELSAPIWGLGFQFGLQKIRDLAFMCPKSVVGDQSKELRQFTI